MKNLSSIFIVLLVIVATVSVAVAEPQVYRISVREALLLAIKNSFDIRSARLLPSIGEADKNMAAAEFDMSIFATGGKSRSVTPSGSAFANPEVGTSEVDSAEVGLRQKLQQGANYELKVTTSRTKTNSNFSGLEPQYDSALALSISQPLLKGLGADLNGTFIFIAENSRKINRAAYQMAVMEVITSVKDSYWDMVYLQNELEVQKESLSRAEDFLKRIELQVQVGVLAPIEIAAAKAFVAVRREALIGISQQIGNNQDRLKSLINIERLQPGGQTELQAKEKPTEAGMVINVESVIEKALTKRPDYIQAKLQLESSQRSASYYDNQSLPKLNIEGAISYKGVRGKARTISAFGTLATSSFGGTYGDSFSDIGSGSYYDYYIGLSFEMPIFNRYSRNRQRKASIEADVAASDMLRLKQVVRVDVLRAVRGLSAAKQRISATRLSRVLAEQKLSAEMKKYEVGSSTSFAVLEFQKDLAAEKSKEMKSVVDYQKAIAHLDFASGSALTANGIELRFE